MPDLEKLTKMYIPMSEPSFLILSTLLEPLHGYGIIQKVEEITEGRIHLGAGTVYTVLYKMENDGIIKVVEERERRKIYQITPLGRKVLEKESMRIVELSKGAFLTLERLEEEMHTV